MPITTTIELLEMIDKCLMLDFNSYVDDRGSLVFSDTSPIIPFEIRRFYFLYNVPADKTRGKHAHRALQQVFLCLSGSVEILLDDGNRRKKVILDNAEKGLYVCPMIWRELKNFTHDAICMVFASEKFDEDDYIRDEKEFFEIVKKHKARGLI